MLSRLFALPCYLLIALLTLLPVMPAQAVGLPGMLGGSSKTQPQAEVPLGQSLDEVIKTLENDQQRTQLLSDLKKLRAMDAVRPGFSAAFITTKPARPTVKVELVEA